MAKSSQRRQSVNPVSVNIRKGERKTMLMEFTPGEKHEMNVTVGEGARLTLVCVEDGSSLTQKVKVAKRGQVRLVHVTLGSATVECVSNVDGEDATSAVDWVFRAGDSDRQELSVRNVFTAKRGGGDITVKGIGEGKGQVGSRGMIAIGKKAAGTEALLRQDVLMLDPTAKVDAVPALEIKTNDVKASHSASVSKISGEELFYCASRGIGESEAKAMIVRGFLSDALSGIADKKIRSQLEAALFRGKRISGRRR
jgi:Fe-S cluster assembly scaffold protein SufB